MTNIDKSTSPEAYQRFLVEVVTMVQNHRVVAVKSVQNISNLNQLGSEIEKVKQPASDLENVKQLVSNSVAKYSLSKQLPSEFLGKFPSAEDFRQILVVEEKGEL